LQSAFRGRVHARRNDATVEVASRVEGSVAMKDRGFASMNQEKRREIASKGGRAAHEKGTAHRWTPDQAREAGRLGGLNSRRARNPVLIHESAQTLEADTEYVPVSEHLR
jgi:hypothetical protein